jgi:exodeoxyribonuclease VII small subunit
LSPKKAEPAAPRSRRFESVLAELQALVVQLEAGEVELEMAIELYERGLEAARTCERILEDAELRVSRLAAESASPLADVSTDP